MRITRKHTELDAMRNARQLQYCSVLDAGPRAALPCQGNSSQVGSVAPSVRPHSLLDNAASSGSWARIRLARLAWLRSAPLLRLRSLPPSAPLREAPLHTPLRESLRKHAAAVDVVLWNVTTRVAVHLRCAGGSGC